MVGENYLASLPDRGGRITVESVAGCSWTGWQNDRGIRKYDLIWSAGLFDYFEDKVFVFMLNKLRTMVAEGGEIVIGNFSTMNPSKSYMELFEWHLHHRSPSTLKAFALAAGFSADQISVEKEATGVNLFLHIRP